MSRVERVVVHIGSDKAGSTALQEALHANAAWYDERGVHVVRHGLRPGAGHPDLFANLHDPATAAAVRAEVDALPPGQRTLLLSWEGVHFFDGDERRQLRALVRAVAPDAAVTLVYYVRNQVDLIQSGVLQQVKQLSLPPRTVSELNRPLRQIPARSWRLLFTPKRCFHQRIEEWRGTFPDACIVARLYDRARLVGGDVVDDFNDVLGLVADASFARPRIWSNASLTVEAAAVLDRLYGLAWSEVDRRRVVDTLLAYPDGTGAYLYEDTRAAMEDHYRADNHRLVRDHPHCEGIGEPRSRPRVEVSEEDVERCARFAFAQGSYPTVLEGRLRAEDLTKLNLAEGWDRHRAEGVWALGPRTVLRFRPRGMHVGGYSRTLSLSLSGRYARRRSRTDEVSVNGLALGPVDLLAGPLVIPLDQLDRSLNVELVLQHDLGRRLLRPEDEQRTFLLRSFGYGVA